MFLAALPVDQLAVDKVEPLGCPAPAAADNLSEHYQTIAQVLLISEAGSYRVGIPWLPPTGAVSGRAAKFDPPLDDFTRSSLVPVQTSALASYCEDLEAWAAGNDVKFELHLPLPTTYERYCFSALLFGIFFGTNFLMSAFFGVPPGLTVAASTVVGGFAGFAGTLLSTEQYRRKSFHSLLSREIMRRRGLDSLGANGVSVLPLGT